MSVVKNRRQQIILAVGLPGSGKSTYFARRRIQPLSSDSLRQWLLDDAHNQDHQKEIFKALRYLLRMRLSLGRKNHYIDATNLTPKERRSYIRLAAKLNCDVQAIYFDVPPEICQKRNLGRKRQVPQYAMQKMREKLVPPSQAEGFIRLRVIK